MMILIQLNDEDDGADDGEEDYLGGKVSGKVEAKPRGPKEKDAQSWDLPHVCVFVRRLHTRTHFPFEVRTSEVHM